MASFRARIVRTAGQRQQKGRNRERGSGWDSPCVSLKLKLKFQHSLRYGAIFYGSKANSTKIITTTKEATTTVTAAAATSTRWQADNGKGVAALSDKCAYISKVVAALKWGSNSSSSSGYNWPSHSFINAVECVATLLPGRKCQAVAATSCCTSNRQPCPAIVALRTQLTQ